MPVKKSFLAFSCPHVPLHDRTAQKWLLKQIADRQPDVVVHLGDGMEMDSASRWPSEASWSIEDEFNGFNDYLRSIREVAGDAELVFIEGNHESNALTVNRIDKRLRGALDYRKEKNVPELQHWNANTRYVYDRRRGVYRLGPVAFAHGFEHAANCGRDQAVLLGDPYGLLITGHTHRPTSVSQVWLTPQIPIPYWHANAGTLRDMDSASYMERKRRHRWGQAIVHGETLITKSPRMSKCWDAETLVFRMFGEGRVN